MQHTRVKKIAAIAAVPLLIALFTGCSASPQDQPGDRPGTGQTSKITDFTKWQLAYAKCMRAEGIDIPDPGKGQSDLPAFDPNNVELFTKADTNCVSKIGEAPARSGEGNVSDQELLAEQLKTAKCFRDAGFDVADPTPDTLMSLPSNVPDDVLDKCIPTISGAGNN